MTVPSSGKLAATERFEPGQHPRLGVVLVADGTLLGDERCDRVGQRDGGGHRDTPARRARPGPARTWPTTQRRFQVHAGRPDRLVTEDVGDLLDRCAVLQQPGRQRVPSECMPWRRFSLTGTCAARACLTRIWCRWSWSENGPIGAVWRRNTCWAVADRAAVPDVVDDRPADVLQQRQPHPVAGLGLHRSTAGCPASRNRRTRSRLMSMPRSPSRVISKMIA